MFYIMPTAHGYKSATATNSNGLPVTIKKVNSTITVTHQNSVTSSYDVFYSQQEADAGATKLTITWSKS
jgi:uridine phosphorylase